MPDDTIFISEEDKMTAAYNSCVAASAGSGAVVGALWGAGAAGVGSAPGALLGAAAGYLYGKHLCQSKLIQKSIVQKFSSAQPLNHREFQDLMVGVRRTAPHLSRAEAYEAVALARTGIPINRA